MKRAEVVDRLMQNEQDYSKLVRDLADLEGAKERFRFDAYTSCQSTFIKDKEYAAIGATADITLQIATVTSQIRALESMQQTLRVVLTHGLEE